MGIPPIERVTAYSRHHCLFRRPELEQLSDNLSGVTIELLARLRQRRAFTLWWSLVGPEPVEHVNHTLGECVGTIDLIAETTQSAQ